MRRCYTNFRPICQARRLPRRPVSSNWPAATPTGHFLSGPSARHVLVRPGQTTRPQLLRSLPHTALGRCFGKLRNADVESSVLCILL